MNRYNISLAIGVVVCLVQITGCLPIPYDTVKWSRDGSTGIACTEEKLYLIDGNTGKWTVIAEGAIGLYPDITPDGKMIAYSLAKKYDDINTALADLPVHQAELIKRYAEDLKQLVIKQEHPIKEALPKLPDCPMAEYDSFLTCAHHVLCADAGQDINKMIAPKLLKKILKKEILVCHLNVLLLNQSNSAETQITSSIVSILGPRFTPDKKHISYLLGHYSDQIGFDLYVSPSYPRPESIKVATNVAMGYDWDEQGRCLLYLGIDHTTTEYHGFGQLKSKEVINDKGELNRVDAPQDWEIASSLLSTDEEQLAFVFAYPWHQVQCGPSGKIFFSGYEIHLPMGQSDEPHTSVFCYDPLLKTVTDVLPTRVSVQVSESLTYFELSHDAKSMLLPMDRNRFMIFSLGKSDAVIPLDDEEGFGDDKALVLPPAWKGDYISCLVPPHSSYLKDHAVEETCDSNQLVIIDKHKGLIETIETLPGIFQPRNVLMLESSRKRSK